MNFLSNALALTKSHRSFEQPESNTVTKIGPKTKTIHLVAHSHQDAGWLLTANEYHEKATSLMFTNVVNYLWENP